MTFSVRGDIMGALGQHFSLNHYQLGLIAGAAFYGYVGAILGGGLLVDAWAPGKYSPSPSSPSLPDWP